MEEAEFTSDEFKNKLYQSLREKGLIENLKSQLRSKLIVELRNSALNQDFPKSTIPIQEEDSLLHRASNSLVADHLRRCQYEYSLAVFLPESGVASDKLFTTRDLLQLLKINPDSNLYRSITSSLPTYNAKGLLWQLLCEIANSHSGGSECKGVQVDLYARSSIVDKLDDVDREYRSRANGEDLRGSNVISEKMLSFQREVEARSKEQLNLEITRFKESEYRNLQMEERENFRLKLESSRKDLEKMYEMRCRALEERERNTTERLQQQQQIVQKEMHAQRQNLLEELQMLRSKESEVRRESEVNQRAAKLEEDKRVAVEENLKLRETAVHNIEDSYRQRLKEQLTQYDLKKRKEYMDRLEDVERRERRVRDEARKVEEESQMNKDIKQQVRDKQLRIEEIQNLLEGSKNELTSANKSNEVLQEKLRDMVDYRQVKENNAVIKRELENNKMRLAETINEYKTELARQDERMQNLSKQASQPSHELVSLKAEVHRARDRVKQEKALMESIEAQLKSKLQNEADRNRELQRQLDEQTLQMKEMNRELLEVRSALQETRTALSNEIYRKPNQAAHFTSGLSRHDTEGAGHLPRSNLLTTDHQLDDGYLPIRAVSAGHDPLLMDSRNQYGTSSAWQSSSPSPDTSLAFLENTRERFRSLEREAENLEQSYKTFQHKMTNPIAFMSSSKRTESDSLTPQANLIPSELLQNGMSTSTIRNTNKQRKYGIVSNVADNPTNAYSATGSHGRMDEYNFYPISRAAHDMPSSSGMSRQRSSTDLSHENQQMPGITSSGLNPLAVIVDDLQAAFQPYHQGSPHAHQINEGTPHVRQIKQGSQHIHKINQDSPHVRQVTQGLQTLTTVGGDDGNVTAEFVHDGSDDLRRFKQRDDAGYDDPGMEASGIEPLDGVQEPVSDVNVPSLDGAWKTPSKDQSVTEVNVPSLDGAWKTPSKDQSVTEVNVPSLDGAWKTTSKDQSVTEVNVPSLDGAWKTPSKDQSISLDNTWKTSEQLEKEKDKKKQEEKEWEERRIQRMEERQKKEQEARERERKMLEQLEKQEVSEDKESRKENRKEKEEDRKEIKDDIIEENTDDTTIDPIMQKYMKMVQEKQSQGNKQNQFLIQKQDTFDADVADYVEYADVKSSGGVSDTSDPFADW